MFSCSYESKEYITVLTKMFIDIFYYYISLYPKRSKAAYPPPRCVLDHKLNGFIFSYEYTKLIVFAQNLWWMKNESIMTSDDLVMI